MEPLQAHERAQRAFSAVLAEVGPEQLDGPTPCSQWTVRQLVDHVVGGNNRVSGAAATASGAGGEGGIDLVEAHQASAERAGTTFAAPDGMTRAFSLPFGEVPGAQFIGMRTTDVLVHAWDLARATGQDSNLEPELAADLLDVARQRVRPEFRVPGGPFGAEQPCPPDGPAADRLAAFLGRPVG